MKSKEFDKVKPYTYFITRLSDNKKYHGVRISNKISPKKDFGIKYFGSSTDSFCDQFKKNPKKFKFRICWTFSDKKEAGIYEVKVNRRIYKKSDWANKSAFPFINIDDDVRKKISLAKIGKNTGSLNHFFGKKHSRESIKKIKQKTKGRKLTGCQRLAIIYSNLTRVYGEKTIRKLSKINKGKKFPKSFGEKISKSRLGIKLSPEHKIAIGKGVKGKKNGMFNKTHSKEARLKISKSRVGKTPWNKGLKYKSNAIPWNKGIRYSIIKNNQRKENNVQNI